MRVTLLTSWCLEGVAGSGVVTSILGVRDALRARGHAVGVIAAEGESTNYLAQGVRRIAFNHRLSPLRIGSPQLVAGFDFDGFALPARRPWPFVHVNGGVLADILPFERGLTRWMLRELAGLERRAARAATVVVTPSRYAADAVMRHYGVAARKIRVVPFGIEAADWHSSIVPDPDPPVVLAVARLYPRKGIRLLLEAFARVAASCPAVRLEIAGDGLLRPEIEARIRRHPAAGRITLHGQVERASLPALYRRASVFCLPSRHETFGFAFLEAMAAGRPVVALGTTAVPEMVIHGETGLLAADDDPDRLAALLGRLLDDPAECARLGAGARQRAREYTWERTGEQLEDVFRSLVE